MLPTWGDDVCHPCLLIMHPRTLMVVLVAGMLLTKPLNMVRSKFLRAVTLQFYVHCCYNAFVISLVWLSPG